MMIIKILPNPRCTRPPGSGENRRLKLGYGFGICTLKAGTGCG
jgi:hypothetical protein